MWRWLKQVVPKWHLGEWNQRRPAVCPSFILSHTMSELLNVRPGPVRKQFQGEVKPLFPPEPQPYPFKEPGRTSGVRGRLQDPAQLLAGGLRPVSENTTPGWKNPATNEIFFACGKQKQQPFFLPGEWKTNKKPTKQAEKKIRKGELLLGTSRRFSLL